MHKADSATLRFVQRLVGAGLGIEDGAGGFSAEHEGRGATLPRGAVAALASQGILAVSGPTCRPTPLARTWLRRQRLSADPFAAQHRQEVALENGARLDLEESPLARLAMPDPGTGQPYLTAHQVAAGERVRLLTERARLRQRVTMVYSGQPRGGQAPGGIDDLALDARKALARIESALPRDCAGVVFDVCGLLKGLQQVESERGWPQRSAKLVLRIGLEQVAQHLGMVPAPAPDGGHTRHWRDDSARPTVWS